MRISDWSSDVCSSDLHDRAMERRNWVLGQMAENGYITGAERDAAIAQPLGAIRPYQIRPDRMGSWFVEDVRSELIDRFGETAEDGPNSVYAGGLWVRTSIDPVKIGRGSCRERVIQYV